MFGSKRIHKLKTENKKHRKKNESGGSGVGVWYGKESKGVS